jgi:hypothetical protein
LLGLGGLLSALFGPGAWEDNKSSFTKLSDSMGAAIFDGFSSAPLCVLEGGLLSPITVGVADK